MAELLTVNEAAERMHVSRQTIYAWIDQGKVRPVRTPGGRPRIPEDQLIVDNPERPEQDDPRAYPIRDISELEPLQAEQMGSKEKYWFGSTKEHWYWDCEGGEFLFKVGREGTGDNWAEKVTSELCDLLGLPHAEYDLATFKNKKGVITPNFVPDGARLVHGNEILEQYDSGYERERRYKHRQHKLRLVLRIVGSNRIEPPSGWSGTENVNSAIDVFVGYLMLDAWIANQDRHHENWAVVFDPRDLGIYLAPTFDHASSLGRNETDGARESRLTTRDWGRSMERYTGRAKSAFYPAHGSARPLSTFAAFGEIAARRPDAARYWIRRLEVISLLDTRDILVRIPKEEMSAVTVEFTQKILELNRERLLATEV